MSHAKKHNNTPAQRILTGIHRLLVTYRGGSDFSSAYTYSYQGQLQTSQSVSL